MLTRARKRLVEEEKVVGSENSLPDFSNHEPAFEDPEDTSKWMQASASQSSVPIADLLASPHIEFIPKRQSSTPLAPQETTPLALHFQASPTSSLPQPTGQYSGQDNTFAPPQVLVSSTPHGQMGHTLPSPPAEQYCAHIYPFAPQVPAQPTPQPFAIPMRHAGGAGQLPPPPPPSGPYGAQFAHCAYTYPFAPQVSAQPAPQPFAAPMRHAGPLPPPPPASRPYGAQSAHSAHTYPFPPQVPAQPAPQPFAAPMRHAGPLPPPPPPSGPYGAQSAHSAHTYPFAPQVPAQPAPQPFAAPMRHAGPLPPPPPPSGPYGAQSAHSAHTYPFAPQVPAQPAPQPFTAPMRHAGPLPPPPPPSGPYGAQSAHSAHTYPFAPQVPAQPAPQPFAAPMRHAGPLPPPPPASRPYGAQSAHSAHTYPFPPQVPVQPAPQPFAAPMRHAGPLPPQPATFGPYGEPPFNNFASQEPAQFVTESSASQYFTAASQAYSPISFPSDQGQYGAHNYQYAQQATPKVYTPEHPTAHNSLPGTHHYQTLCNVNDLARAIFSQKRTVHLNLPTFSGKPLEWLMFRRIYDRTKKSYDVIENLTRLSAALQGPAHEAVATLLVTADDPELVIEVLHRRFGQAEIIVSQLVSDIRSLPRLSGYDAVKELNSFSCKVSNYVNTVRLLDQNEYLASPELITSILSKLPVIYKEKWFDYAFRNDNKGKFKVELLAEFLSYEAQIHTAFSGLASTSAAAKSSTNPSPLVKVHVVESLSDSIEQHKVASSGGRSNDKVCEFCNTQCRSLSECKKFLSLSVEKRLLWVNEKKLCRKCLKKGRHNYRACKKLCTVSGCANKFTHHALLHEEPDVTAHLVTPSEVGDQSFPTSELEDDALVAHTDSPGRCRFDRPLLKVIPVTISGSKGSLDTYALLDDGSTATLIDRGAAETIGAVGDETLLRVDGVGGFSKVHKVQYVNLKIKGRYGDEVHELKNVRSLPDLGLGRQSVQKVDIQNVKFLGHLVKELCYEDAQPLILIGNDNWHLTISQATIRGTPSQPVAVRTALGWVVYGYATKKCSPVETEAIHHIKDRELDELIREHYKLESIGITQKEFYGANEQRAIDVLNRTTRRLPSGRFETGLIWKSDSVDVPRSFDLALSRFLCLERKFKKDRDYANAYKENIKTTIQKGYAEPCTKPPNPNNVNWYLPHFGVLHPQKKKLRVVHDAAAECKGVSLNKLLLAGPDILRPLLGVLMQFREPLVALNGDIREMFPQTKIQEADRDAQRFLWRDNPSNDITEYRMSSMIFGAASSPFTAQYLKNRNAEEFRAKFPLAASAIINDHYMDDFLGGADTVEEAAQLARDIVYVHGQAGLEMRSWVSNNPSALSLLPDDLKAQDSTVHVNVLGMRWDLKFDTLTPLRNSPQPPKRLSKRSILSHLMQVYDPLGLLIPIVIRGRVLFQQIWRLGVGWDESLPVEFVNKWSLWYEELTNVGKELLIPRCYFNQGDPINKQLHVLADASELAYACVAYWRYTFIDGTVKIALIGGKARLSPLRPVSIPRLELQAALIAARFSKYTIEAHKRKPDEIFYWSDSLTVLNWLKSDGRTFKPFVAHRIGEILEITILSGWRYVPTALNVADDATRCRNKFEIPSRWFSGPSFLSLPPSEWPKLPTERQLFPPEELKSHPEQIALIRNVSIEKIPIVPDVTRFSSWYRLVRTTARVFLVAKIFRSLLDKKNGNNCELPQLEPEDLNNAETRLLLSTQMESFEDEYKLLRSKEPLPTKSRLKKLDIFVGEDLLVRLAGRTTAAKFVGFSCNPILLDAKHLTVMLLVVHYHQKFMHGNNETVVNEIRQLYFIFGLRTAVKRVARACVICQLRRASPVSPPVGDLPPERLAAYQRPFTFTGVDYFGPMSVSVGRRTEKRYVALFTCLTIRAVHLEVVHDLTADCAIMALRRFVARRGAPTKIFSDNGTAFVGANNILTQLRAAAVSSWKIKWSFIPPSSPFMGGCWERLVRSVKVALSATLKERSPREDVLTTLLSEAEALINSRPLTHVSTDPEDDVAVTPFHFLIGSTSPYEPLTDVDEADLVRRVHWRKGLRLADHFWARWVKEYVPSLTPRVHTDPQQKTVNLGDLVLIADGNLPRGVWPKGRVIALHPGKDGITRVVTVDTKAGQFRRPVKKIVIL